MARHSLPSSSEEDSTTPVASVSAGSPRRRWPRTKTGRFIRDAIIMIAAAVVVSVGVKAFLVQSFYIPSESMESTLMVGDRILVNELQPDVVPLHRGDIVVFKDPGGWLPSNILTSEPGMDALSTVMNAPLNWLTGDTSNDRLVKRIVGLPGDHVSCCSATGKLEVNGVEVVEPYVQLPAGTSAVSELDFNVVVPEGSLFVLGDNRYNSGDSRYHADTPTHGFVPYSNVVGTAFLVTWPLKSIHWLGDYSDSWGAVPPATGTPGTSIIAPAQTPASVTGGDFEAAPLTSGNG